MFCLIAPYHNSIVFLVIIKPGNTEQPGVILAEVFPFNFLKNTLIDSTEVTLTLFLFVLLLREI